MIITQGNDLVSEVHDRMLVILEPGEVYAWLTGGAGAELLKPAANEVFRSGRFRVA